MFPQLTGFWNHSCPFAELVWITGGCSNPCFGQKPENIYFPGSKWIVGNILCMGCFFDSGRCFTFILCIVFFTNSGRCFLRPKLSILILCILSWLYMIICIYIYVWLYIYNYMYFKYSNNSESELPCLLCLHTLKPHLLQHAETAYRITDSI